ncbi:MAG: zinc metallopeptidase [Clostridiales bacterium]|nr:zinc metallopeptidase [Clostridiales bacterium]
MYFMDFTYLILIPGLLVSMIAQAKVKGAYKQYSKEQSDMGYAGVQVAQALLRANGVHDVQVAMGKGQLTDHYDPKKRVVVLSPGVYGGSSIASVAIAAHETGHAIQHSESYFPLSIRSAIAPGVQISSSAALPLFFLGLFLGSGLLVEIGIYLFAAVVLFQVLTLPVEFDASKRALIALGNHGLVTEEEYPLARKMLSAAALTYVASLMVSLLQLVRLFALSSRRRR